ncbi:MAG: DUF448 domain-containing protein [Bacilli bacterium]|nr:DUF448 domain-containing protein [Bacilli bacterium]
MRKENPRRDIVSRQSFPKGELFRIALSEGCTLDLEGNLKGRAVYIHKDLDSVQKCKKKGLLEKYGKGKDLASIYEAMEKALC